MVENIRRPSGPMSSIPIKMDSIIKNYFNRYRGLNQLPPILDGNINGRLAVDMPKTLKCRLYNGVTLWGRPDDYIKLDNGSVVSLDHKTRSKEPESVHPAYQLQLDVYSYLLEALDYSTSNKAFLAFYYPDNCDLHNGMPFFCKVIEVDTSPSGTLDLINKAISVLKGPLPDPGKNCGYCKWVEKITGDFSY
jgi:hypothetical protein